MKLVQPAQLNRYVDATIPLTWAKRWEIVTPVLPMFAVFVVLMVEMVALRLWMDGLELRAHWFRLVAAPLAIIAILMGGIELQLQMRHRTKRWLKLDPNRITTEQGGLPWKRLVSWRLEPVSGKSDLRKLTLEHLWSKKIRRSRCMVLQHPDQTQALKSEAAHFQQRGITTFALVESAESQPAPARRRVRGMFALALAYYFFLHGIPILFVGVFGGDKPTDSERTTQTPSAGPERLGRMLVKRFPSPRALRRAFVLTGVGLTGVGLAFYVWGFAWQLRGTNPSRNTPLHTI